MDDLKILGFVAAFLTTVGTLPQVIKVVKTKKTKDLSFLMYGIMTVGIFLWLVYGVFMKDTPLMIANGISFISFLIILLYKIKYK